MKTLTIFTPTYNRGELLKRLYISLCNQSCKDFEWLIVDDGSTDDTRKIVENWIDEGKINIVYLYQVNGGKMRAHNTAVKYTNNELFLCVDSDDYLVSDAVEEIIRLWGRNSTKYISGIVALKAVNASTNSNSNYFPEAKKSTLSNLYRKGFRGETTLVFKTKILKEHLFPEIDGEKFITEKYVYDQIDQNYELIVFNKIFTISEYLEDGYTENSLSLIKENPKGWALFYNQGAELGLSAREKYLNSCRYVATSIWGKDYRFFIKANNKFFCLIGIPGGLFLYFRRISRLGR